MNTLKAKSRRLLQSGALFSFTLSCALILFISLTATKAFAVPPSVIISSPTASTTNNTTPQLIYSASTGTVVVKVDNVIVSKVSGDNLDTLSPAKHTVQVEATNASAETGFGEVSFTIDTAPPTETVFTKISAGSLHTAAIKSDGTLWTWGDNSYGQLGDGTIVDRTFPVQVGTETQWVAVAAGASHTLAIKADGSLWAWGRNNYGQLGIGSTEEKHSPSMVGTLYSWALVESRSNHVVALKTDGTLWAWGLNTAGQLGDGTFFNKPSPVPIGAETNWSNVSVGGAHTLALKSDGSLWAWGDNTSGQLGNGTLISQSTPTGIANGTTWISISAGLNHSVAINSDNKLWAWGDNTNGQLGDGTLTDRTQPVQPVGTETYNWTRISAGCLQHTLAVRSDGTLWAWGRNKEGQVGDGTIVQKKTPAQIGTATNWASVSGGTYYSSALNSSGTLYVWGQNIYGALNKSYPVLIGTDMNWTSVSGGANHTLALKSDGTLWAWGHNFYGALGLGDGKTVNSSTPQLVSAVSGTFPVTTPWTAISAGADHSLALNQDGSLWAWGYNGYGQLGDGTVTKRTVPRRIGLDNDWVKISAGANHSVAMKSNGSIWAWGDNAYGQLGNGSTDDEHAPFNIAADHEWTDIAAGGYHTLALDSDGYLWAWGHNGSGRLGDGTLISKTTPTKIGTETDWTHIAGGSNFSLAIKSNGSLWGWGTNTNGQLGIDTLVSKTTPTQVGSANDWVMATAGFYQSVALKQNGTVWAWGYNAYGEVGDGTATRRTSPVQIYSEVNWSLVDAGWYHSLALQEGGTLWAWGFDGYGQLGNDGAVNRITPTQTITPGNILINNGASYTNSRSVTLALAATDANGISQMQFSNDGLTWSEPELFAANKDWILTPDNEMKTVSVMFQDKAGNWSSIYSATITLDVKPLEVIITSPSEGFTTNSMPLLSYLVNAGAVVVKVDGIVVSKVSGSNLDALTDGQHTVQVELTSASGRYGSDEVNFIVDTTPPSVTKTSILMPKFKAISTGFAHSLAIATDGSLWAWGYNYYGALGDEMTPSCSFEINSECGYPSMELSYTAPIRIGTDTTWAAVSAGYYSSLALKSDGSLWAWGNNYYGQLGDGTTVEKHAPIQIGSDKNWKFISIKDEFAIALKQDGTLWAWRISYGDGTPFQIGTSTNWAAISTGTYHVLALQSDGTLWSWGGNSYCELGNGDSINRNYQSDPVKIGVDADWIAIDASTGNSFALKTNGTLWAWGWGGGGLLGDGISGDQCVPIRVGSDADWTSISAAAGSSWGGYALALKSNGTLWAWPSVWEIGTDTTWTAISAGAVSSLALKSDGTLWESGWYWSSDGMPALIDKIIVSNAILINGGAQNTNDTSVSLTLNASDATSGVAFMKFSTDGVSWTDLEAYVTTKALTLSPGDSEKYIYVKFQDAAGNWSAPFGDSIFLDTLAPNVTLASPVDGLTNNAAQILRYSASDGTAVVKVDGIIVSNVSGAMLNPLADGVHRVRVEAMNAYGMGYAEAVFTVDTLAPVVSISSPIAGTSRNRTPQLSYIVNDEGLIASVDVYVDEVFVFTENGDSLDLLSDGTHTVQVVAMDAAGNAGSAEVTFTVDNSPPAITIVSPVAGFTKLSSPSLIYTVSSGEVTVIVDEKIVSKTSGSALDTLADGEHRVRVEATNESGPGFAEVLFTVDTVVPIVAISSPVAGASKNRTPQLSYTYSDGTVVVKVDGVIVSTGNGDLLSALPDKDHAVLVEATDSAGNTGSAQVTFTVDNTPPTITIVSPVAGTTNLSNVPLVYSLSDGSATATLDGNTVSGGLLEGLANGSHTLVLTATDALGNSGTAQVDFTVDTAAAGHDDTNIYCMGTGTYLVGPSSFTSGIQVPTTGNAVLIASPYDGAAINGPKIIVKGAMDTTIPVSSVMVVVSSGTGTTGYLAQVSGPYFAAKVQVAADTYSISAIATDQTGAQHQASISVYPVIQSNTVDLMANPSVGLPTLKQSGKTTLDASLMSTPTITRPVASYAWDFSGTGSSDLTCYSHSNVTASYEQTGLYLTQVSVTDTAGNQYNDTEIVNVLDRTEIDNRLKPIWNGMKTTLASQDIESIVSLFAEDARVAWRQHFTRLSQYLPQMAADMGELRLVQATDCLVEYDLRTIRNGEEYSFQVLFMKEQDGVWRIKSF